MKISDYVPKEDVLFTSPILNQYIRMCFILDDSRMKFIFMIKKGGGQEYTDVNKCYIIIKANIYSFKKINCTQVVYMRHLYI